MDSKIAEMNPISSVAKELREWEGRIFWNASAFYYAT
jgi:hypothetical protein